MARDVTEISPSVARVAVIYNPQIHTGQYFDSIEAAARSLAIKLIRVAFRVAGDTERGIEEFARQPNGGRLVLSDPSTGLHRHIVTLAARHGLPGFILSVSSSPSAGSHRMGLIGGTSSDGLPCTLPASSKVRVRPICRCRHQSNSSWSSSADRPDARPHRPAVATGERRWDDRIGKSLAAVHE